MSKKKGFIYVIEDEPNICKIGKTTKPVAKRCAELSTCFHRKFRILGFFESEDIDTDESIIHVLLKDYKIRGEWFKISYNEILSKIENLYQFKKHEGASKPKEKFHIQVTFSISERMLKAFNQIYERRILEGRKTDKSALLNEALELLIKKEEEND